MYNTSTKCNTNLRQKGQIRNNYDMQFTIFFQKIAQNILIFSLGFRQEINLKKINNILYRLQASGETFFKTKNNYINLNLIEYITFLPTKFKDMFLSNTFIFKLQMFSLRCFSKYICCWKLSFFLHHVYMFGPRAFTLIRPRPKAQQF